MWSGAASAVGQQFLRDLLVQVGTIYRDHDPDRDSPLEYEYWPRGQKRT